MYVEGSPGSYTIQMKPVDAGDKVKCLARKSCDDKHANKMEDIKVSKCSACGAQEWNINGGEAEGYVLSRGEGKSCVKRSGNKAVTVPCEPTDDYIPADAKGFTTFHLTFASASDIKTMSSDAARLVNAALTGDKSAVNRYLKDNVDVDSRDFDNVTPLIAASQSGHIKIVQILAAANADLEAADKDGLTSLMEASIHGHLPVVKFLVSNSVDVAKTSASGVNAAWLAAGSGHLKILQHLVDNGADCKITRNDGISALQSAAVSGHADVIKYLIKQGMDVNAPDEEGLTPIMNACENGNVAVLKAFIDNGADVNAVSNAGFTALIVASAAGHVGQIELLLKAGASVDALHAESATALMYAAATGHLDAVRILMDAGAAVDLKHANGGTALQEVGASVSSNATIIAQYLLDKGADAFIVDKDGVTPLMSAASAGNCDIVDKLLLSQKSQGTKYVDYVAKSGGSALMFASGNGKVQCVESLLTAGADLHMTVQATAEYLDGLAKQIEAGIEQLEEHVDGVDSLMIAAAAGHEEVVKLLLARGGDPKKKDDDDKTALAAAVKGNFGEVASILVAGGSDPNDDYIDEEGGRHNLLMDAIIVENVEFSKLLIANGADTMHKDEHGVTTLLQASHRGLVDIVDLLLRGGASNVDDANEDGITPVIAAASEGHAEIVDLLIKAKCDTNKIDKDGTNAIMAAAIRGHKAIVASLLGAGAELNAQNVDGHSALMFAYNGKNQVATLYARYKAYMTEGGEEDEEANSEIILEALTNSTKVIEMLIAGGADVTQKDNEGHTPADFDFNPDLDENLLEGEKVTGGVSGNEL
jgi:ankyrin repeat protein